MRRTLWTLGMSVVGFLLGYHGLSVTVYGHPLLITRDLAFASLWAALIGFGFGSVFQGMCQPPRKRVVFWWAFTFALLGAFFAPAFMFLLPYSRSGYVRPEVFILSSAMGGLTGVLLGSWHYRVECRKK